MQWLQAGYVNSKFFHNQARKKIWKNNIKELIIRGNKILGFQQIKEEAFNQYVELYNVVGPVSLEVEQYMLENVPEILSHANNLMLMKEILEEERI